MLKAFLPCNIYYSASYTSQLKNQCDKGQSEKDLCIKSKRFSISRLELTPVLESNPSLTQLLTTHPSTNGLDIQRSIQQEIRGQKSWEGIFNFIQTEY